MGWRVLLIEAHASAQLMGLEGNIPGLGCIEYGVGGRF